MSNYLFISLRDLDPKVLKGVMDKVLSFHNYITWDIHPQTRIGLEKYWLNHIFENPWAVACVCPESKSVVGVFILNNFKGDEEKFDSCEATIIFFEPRKAKQASKQLQDYVFDEFKIRRVYARISALNHLACNFVEKLGFTLCGTIRGFRIQNGKPIDELWYYIEREGE